MNSTSSVEVKRIATTHLRFVLRDYPALGKLATTGFDFSKWCELCAMRLNEIESLGWISGKSARDRFIRVASEAFADRKLALHEQGAKFDVKAQKIVK